jgi:hypothetical protein
VSRISVRAGEQQGPERLLPRGKVTIEGMINEVISFLNIPFCGRVNINGIAFDKLVIDAWFRFQGLVVGQKQIPVDQKRHPPILGIGGFSVLSAYDYVRCLCEAQTYAVSRESSSCNPSA